MDEAKARKILSNTIQSDGSLLNDGEYISWDRINYEGFPNTEVILDAIFTIDQLEAIAWWMKNCPIKIEN